MAADGAAAGVVAGREVPRVYQRTPPPWSRSKPNWRAPYSGCVPSSFVVTVWKMKWSEVLSTSMTEPLSGPLMSMW